jgi:urease accessory protein
MEAGLRHICMTIRTEQITTTTTCRPIHMTISSDQLLTLVQWLSPAYPVGSFAWSHGIETAVRDGQVRDAESLEDWLSVVLTEGAGRNDAILLVAAAKATEADLATLAELAMALQPSRERLAETMGQGVAFASTTRAVWGYDLPDMPYPLAVGRAAGLAALPVEPVVTVFLQMMMSNLVQAAQRLMPLGQTKAQHVLSRLSGQCAMVATEAAKSTIDDLGSGAFAVDIASMRHEIQEPRMFRS